MSMNTTLPIAALLHRVLLQPERGVIGLVDDLLAMCHEHGLQLDWQADRYCVRFNGGDWEELTDVALRKSVFRAILARVAVLCNECTPNSVSLYGGQGELAVGSNPQKAFKVAFVNTPAEQRLHLSAELEPGRENSHKMEPFEKTLAGNGEKNPDKHKG
jgi:hypothetical protein